MKIIYRSITKLMDEKAFDFIEKHRGEIMLDMFDIVRLEEIVDGEDDFYYVYRKVYKGVHYSSYVGSPILLKGQISDKEYKFLEEIFFRNCNTTCRECGTYIDWKQVMGIQHNLRRRWQE